MLGVVVVVLAVLCGVEAVMVIAGTMSEPLGAFSGRARVVSRVYYVICT